MHASRSHPFVLIISGPSGVGKTVVCHRLLQLVPRLARVVTTTTRPPRGRERQDEAYHFLTASEFEQLKAEDGLLEWAEVHGARYGTPRRDVEVLLAQDRVPLLNIDVQGALQIQRRLPGDAVLVFLLPPDEETLRARLLGRKTDDPETVERRLQRAREEIAVAPRYDYAVVNADLDACVEDVRAIYRAETCRAGRVAGGDTAS
ncbi:MAG: guanylate kinase [Candidatus Eisenbacteria bacterium]|nr:guanylate kinase [Candidatus Eisenbacteria bacterium]